MKKSYACIPGSSFISYFFFFGLAFSLLMAYLAFLAEDIASMLFFFVFSIVLIIFIIWQWRRTMWRVRITPENLVCYAPFCDEIIISFNNCKVGFGYHAPEDKKVWWIYLCDSSSGFDTRGLCSHMNALKCEKGFVRILYRNDFFMELIRYLPKQQREAMISSRDFFHVS